MTLSFTTFSWWFSRGKQKEQVSNYSSINSRSSRGERLRGESEALKLKGTNRRDPSSNCDRKVKRKWKSREERNSTDKDCDMVLVPSDGICLSGSESDDSDWSIGWLEPHAPGFQGNNEADDSFAVLVPCYRHEFKKVEGVKKPGNQFLSAINNLPNGHSDDGKKYIEQWLSSLQNF